MYRCKESRTCPVSVLLRARYLRFYSSYSLIRDVAKGGREWAWLLTIETIARVQAWEQCVLVLPRSVHMEATQPQVRLYAQVDLCEQTALLSSVHNEALQQANARSW